MDPARPPELAAWRPAGRILRRLFSDPTLHLFGRCRYTAYGLRSDLVMAHVDLETGWAAAASNGLREQIARFVRQATRRLQRHEIDPTIYTWSRVERAYIREDLAVRGS